MVKSKGMMAIALFLYIYNICFFIMPGTLRTRLIFGIIGILYYFKHRFPVTGIKLISAIIICIITSTIISLINNWLDYWFLQYLLLNVIYIFGAYFIAQYFIPQQSIADFLYIILLCIIVHNVIAFLGLLVSPIQILLTSIQKLSNNDIVSQMMNNKMRAIGLGDGNFFHGGIISGIGLILCLYLGKIKHLTINKCLVCFLCILVTGILIARTTLCGFIGFLMLFLGPRTEKKRLLEISIKLVILGSISITALIIFASDYLNLGWAFEFIYSYLDKGTLETASSNDLATMYIFPENISTLIWGDGRILNDNGSYYMHTDVGFVRHIFYWGIVGSIIYWAIHIYIYSIAYFVSEKSNSILSLIITLFIYALIINLKGFVDINFLIYLIIAATPILYLNKNENSNINQ